MMFSFKSFLTKNSSFRWFQKQITQYTSFDSDDFDLITFSHSFLQNCSHQQIIHFCSFTFIYIRLSYLSRFNWISINVSMFFFCYSSSFYLFNTFLISKFRWMFKKNSRNFPFGDLDAAFKRFVLFKRFDAKRFMSSESIRIFNKQTTLLQQWRQKHTHNLTFSRSFWSLWTSDLQFTLSSSWFQYETRKREKELNI